MTSAPEYEQIHDAICDAIAHADPDSDHVTITQLLRVRQDVLVKWDAARSAVA